MLWDKTSSNYLLWLAWRQVAAGKGGGLSFMTWVSILGVAIGVCALVTVLSVMGGFADDIRSKMFKGLPHIQIQAENVVAGFSLDKYPLSGFAEIFKDPQGIEPYTQADVVLKRRKNLASAVLFGVDPALGGRLWGFANENHEEMMLALQEGVRDNEGHKTKAILLGESLAIQLGAEVGDSISIFSPQHNMADMLAGQPAAMFFQVVGIFHTELPHYDSRYAVVSLHSGRYFMPDYDFTLHEENWVSGVAVSLSNPEQVDDYLKVLRKFESLEVQTWKMVNKSLLFALKLEKFTMSSILLLIVLVATFSISGTMMMTVYHKRSQVALLRSLGMTENHIAKLYILQGFVIGSIGVLSGLALGLLICLFLSYVHLELPSGFYYQKSLPVKFLPLEYSVICCCAWILSLLSASYPARVAAKQDPGMGLRCL